MEHQFEESIARIFGQRARDLLRLGRNGLEIGRHLLGLLIVRDSSSTPRFRKLPVGNSLAFQKKCSDTPSLRWLTGDKFSMSATWGARREAEGGGLQEFRLAPAI